MVQDSNRVHLVGVRLSTAEFAALEDLARAEERSKGAILRRALRLVAPQLDKRAAEREQPTEAAA